MKRPVVRPKAIVFVVIVVVVVVVVVVGSGILPSPLNHSLSYSIRQEYRENEVNSHLFQQHTKSFFWREERARVCRAVHYLLITYDVQVIRRVSNVRIGIEEFGIGKAS